MAYKLRYTAQRTRNDGTDEEPKIATYDQIECVEFPYGALEENLAIAKAEAYGEVTIEEVPDPPMTEEEARVKRNKLLAETDWTQTLDAPISAECREAFRVYRQALRDITEQEGFPETIEWPAMPEVVKAAPDPVDAAVDVLLGGEEA